MCLVLLKDLWSLKISCASCTKIPAVVPVIVNKQDGPESTIDKFLTGWTELSRVGPTSLVIVSILRCYFDGNDSISDLSRILCAFCNTSTRAYVAEVHIVSDDQSRLWQKSSIHCQQDQSFPTQGERQTPLMTWQPSECRQSLIAVKLACWAFTVDYTSNYWS